MRRLLKSTNCLLVHQRQALRITHDDLSRDSGPEGRKILATAEGRGPGYKRAMSRSAAKESFAATAAYGSPGTETTAFGRG